MRCLYSSVDAFVTGAAISTAALTASLNRAFSGLRVGATYYFRVRAINGVGAGSAFDQTVSGFTLPLPSSATLTGAAVSANAIEWSWSGGRGGGLPAIDVERRDRVGGLDGGRHVLAGDGSFP